MTISVGGDRLSYSCIRTWTWLSRCWARFDLAELGGAEEGAEAELALRGSPLMSGTLGKPRRYERHWQVDLVPQVLRDLGAGGRTVDPFVMDRSMGKPIGEKLLDGAAELQIQQDVMLDRWSTRERPFAWAWESLIRSLASASGEPAAWRYSARENVLHVETDRSDWQEATAPARLLWKGEFVVYEEGELQAGDLIEGAEVIATRAIVKPGFHRVIVELA